jgi:hypothetical protein
VSSFSVLSKKEPRPYIPTSSAPKCFPRPFSFGATADHKFLLFVEFNLDPRSGALPGLIRRTGPLTYQAFQPESASPFQKLWNVFGKRDRMTNYARRLFQQFFQFCLSLFDQWTLKVLPLSRSKSNA